MAFLTQFELTFAIPAPQDPLQLHAWMMRAFAGASKISPFSSSTFKGSLGLGKSAFDPRAVSCLARFLGVLRLEEACAIDTCVLFIVLLLMAREAMLTISLGCSRRIVK